jgi:hypothetical protein
MLCDRFDELIELSQHRSRQPAEALFLEPLCDTAAKQIGSECRRRLGPKDRSPPLA